MMIELAGQNPAIRLWSLLSASTLAVTGLIAGVMLVFTIHSGEGLGTYMSPTFRFVSALGITPIAIGWLLYMVVLAIVLGYRLTEIGRWALFLIFALVECYYLVTLCTCVLRWVTPFRAVM